MNPKSLGFIALKSLKEGPPDPKEALAEIRRIYFKTTKKTIHDDFAHAIELLKRLPSDDERQKAHVYMEGLAEMRNQWEGVGKGGEATMGHRKRTRPPGQTRRPSTGDPGASTVVRNSKKRKAT